MAESVRYRNLLENVFAIQDSVSVSPTEEIIDEARQGRVFILVDDENRENEGDLAIPAEKINADIVNFMAREGRGLICLALDETIADRLDLQMMPRRHESRFGTAFTVSIEARHGVTTGISAADRAHTIRTAVDPESGPEDISTPGHIFPLRARNGGVLKRPGQTEAVVDIARLAGLEPAGVICEIMKEDGTMARLPDLLDFAKLHGIKVGTVADIIRYRKQYGETL
jgi:3,4-dihydroxy 2-butanone 4-phosphate synthase/GTP cyclohydrolase II